MAIDWTKPIRQKNGTALRFLYELQSVTATYLVICVKRSQDGNESLVTYTKDGRYHLNGLESPYDAENIPDSEPAHTEIGGVCSRVASETRRQATVGRRDRLTRGRRTGV